MRDPGEKSEHDYGEDEPYTEEAHSRETQLYVDYMSGIEYGVGVEE